MPFWKKKEDPWDMDPSFKRPPDEGNLTGALDSLRDEWTEMKQERQEQRDARRLPPETCPWCGKNMEQGWLYGNRGVYWMRGVPTAKSKWLGAGRDDTMRVDTDGVFYTYHVMWYCPACRRMPLDASDLKTQAEEGAFFQTQVEQTPGSAPAEETGRKEP